MTEHPKADQPKAFGSVAAFTLVSLVVVGVIFAFHTVESNCSPPAFIQQPYKAPTHAPAHTNAFYALPDIVARGYENIAGEARQKLVEGLTRNDGDPFQDVVISLPLPKGLKKDSDGSGQGDKAMAAPDYLNLHGGLTNSKEKRKCVVYGAGIAGESDFEQEMSRKYGCEVHGFDCTVKTDAAPVKNMPFTFHQVCIGKEPSRVGDTVYKREGAKDADYVFKRLPAVMGELGHTYVDVLKFDIEGSEWTLMYDEIIHGPYKPEQLLFELHTHHANGYYVPHHLVEGKHRSAVNQLFLDLFDLGYRVINKDINSGDGACAEFAVVRVKTN